MRDVLKKAKEKGHEIQVNGSGWSIAQEPGPGVPILSGRTCAIRFSTGN